MSITHSAAIRNTVTNAVVDAIDGGSGAGLLVIMNASNIPVATLTFSDPAFGDSSGGTATAAAITADESAAGGTASKFKVTDSAAVTIFEGTVGVTGSDADIELSNVTIGVGDRVAVSVLTYSAPV